jgi:hypothetical protein
MPHSATRIATQQKSCCGKQNEQIGAGDGLVLPTGNPSSQSPAKDFQWHLRDLEVGDDSWI